MKDFLGINFYAGAYVAYPNRTGSNMTLNLGRISRVDETGVYVQHITEGRIGRAQRLVRLDRAVIVLASHVSVYLQF